MARRIDKILAQSEVAHWISELRNGRGISEHTHIAYLTDVSEFLNFQRRYTEQELSVSSLEALSSREMRAYFADCQKREIGAASRNRKLSAVKSFLRYVYKKYELKNDAVLMSRGPKKAQRLPRPLSMIDADKLLSTANEIDKRAWVQARDTALVTLLYACGLRISEALGITKSQTPLGDELRIKGKGNKVRIVPVLPAAKDAIEKYLNIIPYDLEPEDTIFRGIRGGAMSSRQSAHLMEKLRNLLGLPASATPHAMRHSFASHLLAAGGDIRAIQELLGHSSLSATQVYTKIDETQLIDVYRAAHPKGKS